MRERSRRGVLQATAGIAATGGLSIVDRSGQTDTEPAEIVPTTREEIRAAFDEIPKSEPASEREREYARAAYPEFVVPDTGPIPDPEEYVDVTIETAPWMLATAYWKERHMPREKGRQPVVDRLLSTKQARGEYVLPDGTSAVDGVLDALRRESDG